MVTFASMRTQRRAQQAVVPFPTHHCAPLRVLLYCLYLCFVVPCFVQLVIVSFSSSSFVFSAEAAAAIPKPSSKIPTSYYCKDKAISADTVFNTAATEAAKTGSENQVSIWGCSYTGSLTFGSSSIFNIGISIINSTFTKGLLFQSSMWQNASLVLRNVTVASTLETMPAFDVAALSSSFMYISITKCRFTHIHSGSSQLARAFSYQNGISSVVFIVDDVVAYASGTTQSSQSCLLTAQLDDATAYITNLNCTAQGSQRGQAFEFGSFSVSRLTIRDSSAYAYGNRRTTSAGTFRGQVYNTTIVMERTNMTARLANPGLPSDEEEAANTLEFKGSVISQSSIFLRECNVIASGTSISNAMRFFDKLEDTALQLSQVSIQTPTGYLEQSCLWVISNVARVNVTFNEDQWKGCYTHRWAAPGSITNARYLVRCNVLNGDNSTSWQASAFVGGTITALPCSQCWTPFDCNTTNAIGILGGTAPNSCVCQCRPEILAAKNITWDNRCDVLPKGLPTKTVTHSRSHRSASASSSLLTQTRSTSRTLTTSRTRFGSSITAGPSTTRHFVSTTRTRSDRTRTLSTGFTTTRTRATISTTPSFSLPIPRTATRTKYITKTQLMTGTISATLGTRTPTASTSGRVYEVEFNAASARVPGDTSTERKLDGSNLLIQPIGAANMTLLQLRQVTLTVRQLNPAVDGVELDAELPRFSPEECLQLVPLTPRYPTNFTSSTQQQQGTGGVNAATDLRIDKLLNARTASQQLVVEVIQPGNTSLLVRFPALFDSVMQSRALMPQDWAFELELLPTCFRFRGIATASRPVVKLSTPSDEPLHVTLLKPPNPAAPASPGAKAATKDTDPLQILGNIGMILSAVVGAQPIQSLVMQRTNLLHLDYFCGIKTEMLTLVATDARDDKGEPTIKFVPKRPPTPLPFFFSPTAVAIGEGAAQYFAGALAMNLLLLVILTLLSIIVAAIANSRMGGSYLGCIAKLHLPRVLFTAVCLLVPPSLLCGFIALVVGNSQLQLLSSVMLVAMGILVVGGQVRAAFLGRFEARFVHLVPASGGRLAKRNALQVCLFPVGQWIDKPRVSTDVDDDHHSTTADEENEEKESALTPVDNVNKNSNRFVSFLRRWGFTFDIYKGGQWSRKFLVVEVVVSALLLSATAILTASNDRGCVTGTALYLSGLLVHFALLLLFRPHATLWDSVLTTALSMFQTILSSVELVLAVQKASAAEALRDASHGLRSTIYIFALLRSFCDVALVVYMHFKTQPRNAVELVEARAISTAALSNTSFAQFGRTFPGMIDREDDLLTFDEDNATSPRAPRDRTRAPALDPFSEEPQEEEELPVHRPNPTGRKAAGSTAIVPLPTNSSAATPPPRRDVDVDEALQELLVAGASAKPRTPNPREDVFAVSDDEEGDDGDAGYAEPEDDDDL